MDVAAFKAQLEAARRIETDEIDGARFLLQVPTAYAFQLAMESHRDAAGRSLEARAFRQLLDDALVGWTGLLARHVDASGGDVALPFSPEARALLLDNRPDIASRLAIKLGVAMAERRAKREQAAKNSPPASTGS